MPLATVLVRASAPARHGGNLNLKLRLQMPKSSKTVEKSASMSMKRSSTRVAPLEGPLPVANLHCEEALLEIVWDSEEMLAVSTKHRLLNWVSIRIPPVGLVSSPLQLKWLCRTQAAYSLAEVVSSLDEVSP